MATKSNSAAARQKKLEDVTAQEAKIAWRRSEVGRMWVFRWSAQKIADELSKDGQPFGSVDVKTVQRDMEFMLDLWAQRANAAPVVVKAEELEILRHIRVEALEGWERSKLERKSKRTRLKDGESGRESSIETHIEQPVGDPRFLAEARATTEDILKIYGVYAPEKHALTDEKGESVFPASLDDLKAHVDFIKDYEQELYGRGTRADDSPVQ